MEDRPPGVWDEWKHGMSHAVVEDAPEEVGDGPHQIQQQLQSPWAAPHRPQRGQFAMVYLGGVRVRKSVQRGLSSVHMVIFMMVLLKRAYNGPLSHGGGPQGVRRTFAVQGGLTTYREHTPDLAT